MLMMAAGEALINKITIMATIESLLKSSRAKSYGNLPMKMALEKPIPLSEANFNYQEGIAD